MSKDGRNIRQQILALLARKDYRPLDKSELAKELGRKSGVRMALNQVLREQSHWPGQHQRPMEIHGC